MKKRLLQPTLARRVVLALLIAFGATWLVLMAFQYEETRQEEDTGDQLGHLGADVAVALVSVQQPGELAAVAVSLEQLANGPRQRNHAPGTVLVQAWDVRGHRLVYSSSAAGSETLRSDTGRKARQVVFGQTYEVVKSATPRWSILLGVPHAEVSWLVRILGQDLTKYMLIAFPIVLLPVWLAVSQGLRPLRRLSERIAARGADDLSPVGVDPKYAELKPLVSALDTLLVQLRSKIRRERAFVQDAAHELRTPMAVISAQAHVLAKAGSADERREAEQRLDHAIARASHLIQQLLVLARIDEDRPAAPAMTDLAQLVRQELAQCAPAAMARGIELSLDAPDMLVQLLEVQAFQSVLHNLLDNAIRYGHEGGRVAVDLRLESCTLLLSMADDGPGIPDADRERVFDRFFRGSGHDAPGSGLGLSIVKQAVLRLGGSVRLVAGLEDRGCRFVMRIPAAAHAPSPQT